MTDEISKLRDDVDNALDAINGRVAANHSILQILSVVLSEGWSIDVLEAVLDGLRTIRKGTHDTFRDSSAPETFCKEYDERMTIFIEFFTSIVDGRKKTAEESKDTINITIRPDDLQKILGIISPKTS